MMSKDFINLYSLAWPASRVGEAIEVVARKAGLLSPSVDLSLPSEKIRPYDLENVGQWIELVAFGLGFESEAVDSPYNEVLGMVRKAGPALLRLPGKENEEPDGHGPDGHGPYFLALLSGGRWRVKVVAPDLKVHRVRPDVIRTVLTHEIEAPVAAQIDQLLASSGVPVERRARAKEAILREQLSGVRIGGCWLLRISPATDFWQQMRHARLPRQMQLMIGAYIIQQLLMLISGWMIIEGALDGHFEAGWLFGWGFLLFTSLFFQGLMLNAQNALAIGVGGLFKKRLLFGTLQLKPEEIRHQGVGQFLGRVMESEAAENMALGGGLIAIISLIQLLMAAATLSIGVGGPFHALLLLLWVAVTLGMGWRYYRHSQLWIKSYRDMSNDLVERMVGHRTRLAQEDFEHWHDEEDQILAHYLWLSQKMDRISIQLNAIVKRGWLIWGLVGVASTFISSPTFSVELAITLGGIILASTALESLVNGITSVVELMNAWQEFGPLFQAASRAKKTDASYQMPVLLSEEETSKQGQPIILANNLSFRYRKDGDPVLTECTLRIDQGERLLLEGPSGGGKSTLAALLAGLRVPASGLLLLQGLDIKILGTETWRRRVVSAPQFHENHVLTETFAFNLLMGRRWPPQPKDLQEAEIICHELGLGDLLERMPAGMQQMVGESGWQLSHGERSRLYIARALLQNADLIILDESFAALDPENLHRALECVLRRAPTLLVIAHP